MDTYISLFIDDELNLDEKIEFVEKVHAEREYKDQTIQLLNLEKELRSDPVLFTPPLLEKERKFRLPLFRLFAGGALAAAAAVLVLFVSFPKPQQTVFVDHRFVIYQPSAQKLDIAGTFTDWKTEPLTPIGATGYWEIKLRLPAGEHRFTYVVDGEQRIPDPTILTRETDDFGGSNSILRAEV